MPILMYLFTLIWFSYFLTMAFACFSQKNGNAGKISREQGSPNLLGLFYLKNNDATFQAS